MLDQHAASLPDGARTLVQQSPIRLHSQTEHVHSCSSPPFGFTPRRSTYTRAAVPHSASLPDGARTLVQQSPIRLHSQTERAPSCSSPPFGFTPRRSAHPRAAVPHSARDTSGSAAKSARQSGMGHSRSKSSVEHFLASPKKYEFTQRGRLNHFPDFILSLWLDISPSVGLSLLSRIRWSCRFHGKCMLMQLLCA